MKNNSIALLSLLLLPLSSCGEGDYSKKNIEYINEKEACLYTLRDNRQFFKSLKFAYNVDNISEIKNNPVFTCVLIDLTLENVTLSKENIDELYSLLECKSYVWITFYGISDTSFFAYTKFDNEKHFLDYKSASLQTWYNDGKNDYVNNSGYSAYQDNYSNDSYKEMVLGFYSSAVKSVLEPF